MTPAPPQRFHEVDLLRALGILAVVLIHSLRSPQGPSVSSMELWLGQVTRFAVPGFLAASGYLYATREPIAWELTRRRLLRIGIPYLLASALVQLYRAGIGRGPETGSLLEDVLLFASFGPYYFVFVITLFVAIAPGLTRVAPRHLPWLLGGLLLVQLLLETGVIPSVSFFWHLRNPFLWAGYFVLGWLLRLHRDGLVASVSAARARYVALSALLFAGLAGATALPLVQEAIAALAWLGIFAALALAFTASAGGRPLPAIVRRLSDASYAIYLYHLFFVEIAKRGIRIEPRHFEADKLLLVWGCGVLGSLAVIGLGRMILGRRSRALLGA